MIDTPSPVNTIVIAAAREYSAWVTTLAQPTHAGRFFHFSDRATFFVFEPFSLSTPFGLFKIAFF